MAKKPRPRAGTIAFQLETAPVDSRESLEAAKVALGRDAQRAEVMAMIERAEAAALKVLERNGLPGAPGRYRRDAGGPWTGSGPQDGGTWLWAIAQDTARQAAAQAGDDAERLAAEELVAAAAILREAHVFRAAVADGRLWDALASALKAVRLHDQALAEFGPTAPYTASGRKSHGDGAEGLAKRAPELERIKLRNAALRQMAAEMQDLGSWSKIASAIRKELQSELSARQIRRIIAATSD